MKKKLLVSLFLIFFSLPFFSQKTINPDEILGMWNSNLGKGRVEITKENDIYHGKLVWLKIPEYPDGNPKLDKHNPDKLKQGEPLIGLFVLNKIVFVKDHWDNGTIYDPESGKTYSCRITIKDDKLEMRGYIGISQIGRTQTWTRFR